MFWKPTPALYHPHLRPRVRAGKGVGHGLTYKPWLSRREVPSQGTSSGVEGLLISRPYHLLSELETMYLFLVERGVHVVDIREQWPILDLNRTLELCRELGIPHKYKGVYPEPATIDFLITEKVNGKLVHRAASIKTPEDASRPEVRRRLAVEYRWCQERGIPWTLVDTSRFNKTVLESLRFIRGWFPNRYQSDEEYEKRFAHRFLENYSKSTPLAGILRLTGRDLRLDQPSVLDAFKYCAWASHIPVSLRHPISLNSPLVLGSAP